MDRIKNAALVAFVVLCSGADGLIEVVAGWIERIV